MNYMFDTLRLAQALRDEAKFPHEQAEATARALATSMSESAPVTTKELDVRVQELEFKLKDLEQRMTIRLGGMMIGGFGIVLAAMRYFSVH